MSGPRTARTPRTDVRLANEAWEALLGAHARLMREFASEPVWREHGLSMREYDVLYTLAKQAGPTRLGEVQQAVLLSQPAFSRLVDRLAERGFVSRSADPADGRSVRIALTETGLALQRSVGRAHARSVAAAVSGVLSEAEQRELQRIAGLLAGAVA